MKIVLHLLLIFLMQISSLAGDTSSQEENLESIIIEDIVDTTVRVTFERLYHLSAKEDGDSEPEEDVEIQSGDVHHVKSMMREADIVHDERTPKQRRQRLSACFAVVQKAMQVGRDAYESAFAKTVEKYKGEIRSDDIGRTVFFASLASCYNKVDDDFAASLHKSLIASPDMSVNIPKPDLEFVDMVSIAEKDPIALSPELLDVFREMIKEFTNQHESGKSEPKNPQNPNKASPPTAEARKALTISRLAGYSYLFGVLGLMGGCIWYAAVKLSGNAPTGGQLSKRAQKMKAADLKKRN